jgi:hypothetical protein
VSTCVQHLRKLRGGSQSHLLQASDGACYVTKFQNNPQHIRVLANQMLARVWVWSWACPRRESKRLKCPTGSLSTLRILESRLAGTKIPCRGGDQLGSLKYLGRGSGLITYWMASLSP